MNDKDIVQLFFERSQQAITQLSQKYGKLCFRIAMNILKCTEDAEECENDTYLNTWNSIPPDVPICLRAYVSRIAQKQEVSVEDAAGEMKEELLEHYPNVSDIMVSELPKGLYLRADEGTAWDCEVKEVYFVDNGLGGVFVITASYIVEATEGTGVRFHSMIETFNVLEPSE